MSLIELTDGSRRLFDPANAESFSAQGRWDAVDERYVNTGKVLYRTSYANYVMFEEPASWAVISPDDAHRFLAENGHQAAIPTTPDGEFTTVSPRTVFSTRLPADLTARVKATASIRRVTVQDAAEEAFKLWLKTV